MTCPDVSPPATTNFLAPSLNSLCATSPRILSARLAAPPTPSDFCVLDNSSKSADEDTAMGPLSICCFAQMIIFETYSGSSFAATRSTRNVGWFFSKVSTCRKVAAAQLPAINTSAPGLGESILLGFVTFEL